MAYQRFNKLSELVFLRLKNELDPRLYYHNLNHTKNEVLPAAVVLAEKCDLSEKESLTLQIAVLFHDTGYPERYEDNEEVGIKLAKEALHDFGYPEEQISTIAKLIRATRMPQSPNSKLEAIICDADLSTLGRGDFFISSMKLWREVSAYKQEISLASWMSQQYDFISRHRYFTDEARAVYDGCKNRNIRELAGLLKMY